MYSSISQTNKIGNRMAFGKFWLWLLDFLGIGTTIAGIITNFENVRSTILFILGVIFVLVRLYFIIVQKKQAVREKELDLWNKEQDKIDRQNKNKL